VKTYEFLLSSPEFSDASNSINLLDAHGEVHLHSNNRLYKPWFWNVKIHSEGARRWHVGKESKGPRCQTAFWGEGILHHTKNINSEK
jgi:hypothetical protein